MSMMPHTSADEKDIVQSRYEQLDRVLKQPILKKHLFPSPVIIRSVELLEFENTFICRVRSECGAEGIAVAHPNMITVFPIFVRCLQPFFVGQDVRELDLILERVFVFQINFRMNGLPIGIPLATLEHAILDMMGKMVDKPVAELIGEIMNTEVGLYRATEFRELPLEQHFERVVAETERFDVNAVKLKVGYHHFSTRDIHFAGFPGKTERLIPMLREHFGDDFYLYADSNGYYEVDEAIRIGRILEEYNYEEFEEPVLYWHFEETKKVADALTIPVTHGEQDQSFYNFRWLLANDGIDIVKPDVYYFGGFIRSLRVSLMAHAMGKRSSSHMTGGGLGFIYNAIFVSVLPNPTAHHQFKTFDTRIPYDCPTVEMEVVSSKMGVPTSPGLGVTVDPEYVARHRLVTM